MDGAQDEPGMRQQPSSSRTLGASGMAVVATPRGPVGGLQAGGGEDEDHLARYLAPTLEEQMSSSSRYNYPRRNKAPGKVDQVTGEVHDQIPRRIVGFGLGFEKIFASTSFKLPVSAYTIYVELHAAHNKEVFSRCFNGLHTLMDLKKWVFEKLLVPISAYDLSYAEPGKATLTDTLRLLTTEESLDTRTLVTTQAVHRLYKGAPGVHSIGDVGVTRLYVRLKCRTCGDLLNSLQACRKYKKFGDIEALPDASPDDGSIGQRAISPPSPMDKVRILGTQDPSPPEDKRAGKARMRAFGSCADQVRVPGVDPAIEDLWYRPDPKKHCLFHTRGFEMFQAAGAHGSHAELARIYISSGQEPSKKLKLASNVLNTGGHALKISY